MHYVQDMARAVKEDGDQNKTLAVIRPSLWACVLGEWCTRVRASQIASEEFNNNGRGASREKNFENWSNLYEPACNKSMMMMIASL